MDRWIIYRAVGGPVVVDVNEKLIQSTSTGPYYWPKVIVTDSLLTVRHFNGNQDYYPLTSLRSFHKVVVEDDRLDA